MGGNAVNEGGLDSVRDILILYDPLFLSIVITSHSSNAAFIITVNSEIPISERNSGLKK